MKKVLTLSLLGVCMSLQADMSQQAFLYKDPRMMGMGGAATAVGGYSSAVFYNPAGLINIKKSHGAEVDLIGVTAEGTRDILSFVNDVKSADGVTEMTDILSRYSGDVFHGGVSTYSSFSYHTEDDLAFSFGFLGASDANFIVHANGGSNGLLETHARSYGDLYGAAAKRYDDIPGGKLTVGLGLKYVYQFSVEAAVDAGDLFANQDNFMNSLAEDYLVQNSGFAADIGVLYELQRFDPLKRVIDLHPSVGLSLMNVGTLNFDNAYGAQPITLNAGFAIAPEVPYLDSLIVSLDYVDIFNAQQMRAANSNSSDNFDIYTNMDVTYDFWQHLRAGLKVGVVDNMWVTTTLMAGLYQGSYTAGLDFQLTILKIQAATYQEQMGGSTGELEDRRYVLSLGIGW